MPYVKLKSIKNIKVRGALKTYYPGDTVEVGRQTAKQWILDGTAEDPYGQVGPAVYENIEAADNYGIVILAPEGSVSKAALGHVLEQVQVKYSDTPELPYEYTFIWDPRKPVSPQLLNYGWLRIAGDNPPKERWEMAAGLVSMDATAETLGTEEEQFITEKQIGDLRVPVYDSRRIWARQCRNSEKFLEEYCKQLDRGTSPNHAFLRALYTQRPMLCTLPFDWTRR